MTIVPSPFHSQPVESSRSSVLFTLLGVWAIGFLYGVFLISEVLFHPDPIQFFHVPPLGDLTQSVIGLNFFRTDIWRFPIFSLPHVGFPEGTSAIFTDSIPALALAIKLVSKAGVNLQGDFILWYIPISWSLNSVAMVVVFRSLGVRNAIGMIVALILILSSPIILERPTHITLQSHYLLLFSFALLINLEYQLSRYQNRKAVTKCIYLTLLTFIASLIHFYLFVILFCFNLASLTLLVRKKIISFPVYIFYFFLSTLLIFSFLFVSGYFIRAGIVESIAQTYVGGFNTNSANLATLITGATGWTLGELLDLTRNSTGGQYEGYCYLGWPVIIALIISLFIDRTSWRLFLSSNRELVTVSALLFIFSLSMVVHFSGVEILDYSIVKPYVRILTAPMTSPGRFIWPLSYLVGIVAITIVLRRIESSKKLIYGISFLAFFGALSFFESDSLVERYRKPYLNLAAASVLSADQVKDNQILQSIIVTSTNIFVFPTFNCSRTGLSWPTMLRIHLVASKQNIPINENYNARASKDCDRERNTLLSREKKVSGQLIVVRDPAKLSLLGVPDYEAYVNKHSDLLHSYESTVKNTESIENFGRLHWKQWGLSEGRVMPRYSPILIPLNEDYANYKTRRNPICKQILDSYFCR